MDSAHEGHSVHLVVYHSPKRRGKALVGPLPTRLEQIVRAVAAEHDWTVIALAIQPDHVHLFMSICLSGPIPAHSRMAPSDSPRLIKGRRSRSLRDEFPHLKRLPSLWTRRCCLGTAGQVSQETIL